MTPRRYGPVKNQTAEQRRNILECTGESNVLERGMEME
jgi:hypothetical protein